MATLDRYLGTRDNSFHLIRMAAALTVMVSHAFPIATGDRSSEPLRSTYGLTPGSIAVDIFFVISGLLVTQSLLTKSDPRDFLIARFCRIWPALMVALVLSLVFACWIGRLPTAQFLTHPDTWAYIGWNATVVFKTAKQLPGVFESAPLGTDFNASLWTLLHEVRAYLILLLVWVLGRCFLDSGRWRIAMTLGAGLLLVGHLGMLLRTTLEWSPFRLYFMYSVGTLAYLWRDRIQVSAPWLVALGAVLISSAHMVHGFGAVYSLALAPLVIGVGLLLKGPLLLYNRLGDYSYGTYVYAFPIQQGIAEHFPHWSVEAMLGLSVMLTLAMAAVSWHLIEKPAIEAGRSWSRHR